MKVRVLFLTILALILLAGCGRGEATPDSQTESYQSYQSSPNAFRFSNFSKFPVVTSEPDPDGVSFGGIYFGGDGAYIMVEVTAPQSQSQLWQQDYIYIVDEKTKGVYKDIPVMPKVGPLIGRPAKEGQMGYVMLVNYNGDIKSGSVVTVVLGNYKREHITVP